MPSFTDVPEWLQTCSAKPDFLIWLRKLAIHWTVRKELLFIWARATKCPISDADVRAAGAEAPPLG